MSLRFKFANKILLLLLLLLLFKNDSPFKKQRFLISVWQANFSVFSIRVPLQPSRFWALISKFVSEFCFLTFSFANWQHSFGTFLFFLPTWVYVTFILLFFNGYTGSESSELHSFHFPSVSGLKFFFALKLIILKCSSLKFKHPNSFDAWCSTKHSHVESVACDICISFSAFRLFGTLKSLSRVHATCYAFVYHVTNSLLPIGMILYMQRREITKRKFQMSKFWNTKIKITWMARLSCVA